MDSTPLQDGMSVPEEIKRREDRIAKIKVAKREMEERAQARYERVSPEKQELLLLGQARLALNRACGASIENPMKGSVTRRGESYKTNHAKQN